MTDPAMIASRLRSAREAIGLSRALVSEKTGIPSRNLVRYEDGTNMPRALELSKLCELYRVSSDFILGLIDRENFLLPGWYVLNGDVEEQILGTTDPRVLDRICEENPGAYVDIGSILTEKTRLLPPEQGRARERMIIAHLAEHGRGSVRRTFEKYRKSMGE